jgi:hypothetical protein
MNLVPTNGEVYLDHVGLFVRDFDASPRRLEDLGFRLTPFVAHMSSSAPGVPPSSSGTGNQCAMFQAGYLEMLGPTGDTPLSRQLQAQLARYPGLHLIAFAANGPEQNHARIAKAGFEPLPLVRLARPVPTETGEEMARFSVIRVPPHVMPEGRIQIVTHHTPHLVWQARYQQQSNGATGLTGVLLCVDDAQRTADRFGRFLDSEVKKGGAGWALNLDRGRIVFLEPRRFQELRPDNDLPCTPYIAEAALETANLRETRRYFDAKGIPYTALGDQAIRLASREALGASFVFHESPSAPW